MRARNLIVFITGFREDPGDFTGLESIWQESRAFSSPSKWIIKPYVWDSDWKSEAQQIARCVSPDAKVCICAYSWGGGYGFTELAKNLGKLGIQVEIACLADPVYRSRSPLLRWLALTRIPKIKIPHNVARVRWVRQRINRPSGHDLVSQGATVEDARELDVPHGDIDNTETFKLMCLDSIIEMIGES